MSHIQRMGAPGAPEGREARATGRRLLTSPERRARGARKPQKEPSLRDGERVAGTPYVVTRAIGRGGMGEVYAVRHEATGARAALKVLHPRNRDRDDLVARMQREARLLGAVDHRAVVRLLDVGELEDGRPYLVTELLDGQDLAAHLSRRGPMRIPEAIRVIAAALDGLEAIHASGIVHRDVKLENLFLCEDGSVKVIDLGIAKALWRRGSTTPPGVSLGTPRTMAPEQYTLGEIDPRADVYAAGLALYELCAGRGPFDDLRDHPEALRFAHCERRPRPPSALARQPIPTAVEAAILRALAKSPAHRFQSARQMAAALRSLLAPDGSVAKDAVSALAIPADIRLSGQDTPPEEPPCSRSTKMEPSARPRGGTAPVSHAPRLRGELAEAAGHDAPFNEGTAPRPARARGTIEARAAAPASLGPLTLVAALSVVIFTLGIATGRILSAPREPAPPAASPR